MLRRRATACAVRLSAVGGSGAVASRRTHGRHGCRGSASLLGGMHHEAESGRTIVLTTHYLEEADSFAQRIVMLNKGEVQADGSTEEIRKSNSTRIIRATFPDGLPDSLLSADLPGVVRLERTKTGLTITTRDSDAVARFLLTKTAARDITIAGHSLEDSFLELSNASPTTANL